jgi:hypothetical protein
MTDDQGANHRNVTAFESFTWVENDDPTNSVVFVFKDGADKTFLLTASLKIAAEMRARLNEAFAQMEKAGKGAPVPATPERIEKFNAMASRDEPDEVVVFLEGERSNPLFGRMKTTDARALAALLTAGAERGPKPRAN